MDTTTLEENVKSVNGKNKNRIAKQEDIDLFRQVFADHENNETTKTVRVYPRYAFVPNAYKYRADVTVIEATRNETGWNIAVRRVDAHRPHGQGPRVTINGRSQ